MIVISHLFIRPIEKRDTQCCCFVRAGRRAGVCKIVSAQYLEPGYLDLNFKVTEVIQCDSMWKMVSAQYLRNYLMYPHQIWCTRAPWQDKDQVRTRWPWPHFRGHRGHLRRRHMKDGFRWISEEIFDVSSSNLVHRSTSARQRPSSTRWPWHHFQGHRGHLSLWHARWFLLNI